MCKISRKKGKKREEERKREEEKERFFRRGRRGRPTRQRLLFTFFANQTVSRKPPLFDTTLRSFFVRLSWPTCSRHNVRPRCNRRGGENRDRGRARGRGRGRVSIRDACERRASETHWRRAAAQAPEDARSRRGGGGGEGRHGSRPGGKREEKSVERREEKSVEKRFDESPFISIVRRLRPFLAPRPPSFAPNQIRTGRRRGRRRQPRRDGDHGHRRADAAGGQGRARGGR